MSAKNFDEPDEIVELPGLLEEVVEVGGFVVGREVVAPGWRWSKDTKPVVGGEWCEANHVGLTMSGRWGVVMKDGRTLEFRPGDVFDVPAGHDSWTIGDEPCVTLNWAGLRRFFASKALLPERFLATILFTDIVESTSKASELGDTVWTELLAHHEQDVRGELERTHGREVKSTGDGVLAVFGSARHAIEAGLACGRSGEDAGLPLHLGLHAGDVIREDNNVYGGAVNIASRISGLSAAGEVLVSETVRSLARTSAGVRFEDRGEQALKGVGDALRVWAVRQGDA